MLKTTKLHLQPDDALLWRRRQQEKRRLAYAKRREARLRQKLDIPPHQTELEAAAMVAAHPGNSMLRQNLNKHYRLREILAAGPALAAQRAADKNAQKFLDDQQVVIDQFIRLKLKQDASGPQDLKALQGP